MPGYLERLFSSNGFMPHGMCYLWRPDILALHVLADSLITLAYFSIPFSLLYFVRRRKDLQFNWVFVCFAIFIVACGATHLMEIVTIWRPVYWLSGIVKAITALASLPTAVLLVRLVPEALRWPSPAALQRANSSLELEIAERKRAEAEVVDLTRARWADMPQQRGFVIDVRPEHSAQLSPILGVQAEIRDALTNLVLNAVDSMPEGGTLTLRSFGAQHHVTVEICDTGVGMSEEVRGRCLDPFFSTKGERGTGLGLAMVYGMAERHGAELEIDSELGAGTVVRLVFPVAPAREVATPAANAPLPPVRDLRVLVVDDDELLRQSMRAILEREGHQVSVAHGGRVAIDVFTAALQRGERFDAVITDLGMPHVDGRAVAAAVKSMAPNTPVILLTGWGQHLRDDDEIPSYVDHILNKPANLAELRVALAAAAAVQSVSPGQRRLKADFNTSA